MAIKLNIPAESAITVSSRGQTQTVERYGLAHMATVVQPMRINKVEGQIASTLHGEARASADGATILDLRNAEVSGPWNIDMADGRKLRAEPTTFVQKNGWKEWGYYVLAVDENNQTIVEPGQNHRKLYISGSATAMDKAAIAAHAGVSVTTVNTSWLNTHREYGGSEAMPVTEALGWEILWSRFGDSREPCSDWYLYERGYAYGTIPATRLMRGESELHPILIGAWGTGDPVTFSTGFGFTGRGPRYIVLRDVTPANWSLQEARGVIFDGYAMVKGAANTQNSHHVTYRNGRHHEVWHDVCPAQANIDGEVWDASGSRHGAIYSSEAYGFLIDQCVFDHSGWAEGYDYNLSSSYPHPPSGLSHNLYLSASTHGVMIRDAVISRGASFGAQCRGDVIMDNVLMLDNDIAMSTLGGNYKSMGYNAGFSMLRDVVATSAGYKLHASGVTTSLGTKVNGRSGAKNWGLDTESPGTSVINSIVCHRADPDNPTEQAAKPNSSWAISAHRSTNVVTDVSVWKWNNTNELVEGLDPAVLNATTIQRYTADLLEQETGTIEAFNTYLRDRSVNIKDATTAVLDYFRAAYNRLRPTRSGATTLTFLPDPRGDGFYWDNRLNWATGDLPGTHAGDGVDLGGQPVSFGALTTTVSSLACSGGQIKISSGKLTAEALGDAANVRVQNSGQFWVNPGKEPLAASAVGGRLNITGEAEALDLYAGGNAEVLLGPDCTVPAGKSLIVDGGLAKVGWDGTGAAALSIAGTLEFRAGLFVNTYNSSIHQFLPGAAVTGQTSGATARAGEFDQFSYYSKGVSRLWLYDVQGEFVDGEQIHYHTHVKYPEGGGEAILTEYMDTLTSTPLRQLATIQPFRSGIHDTAEPTVAASVTLAAGSEVVVDTTGLAPGSYDLIVANSITNNGATLPAGVSVVGGNRLVLTVS